MSAGMMTCPHCGERFDLMQAAQDKELAQLEAVLSQFGEARGLAQDYIGLFRKGPESTQRVSVKLRLARQVLNVWRSLEFDYDGRAWKTTRGQVQEALQAVLVAKPRPCGFRNHNYLKQIMRGRAAKAEGKAERRAEEQRADQAAERREAAPGRTGADEGQHVSDWPLEVKAAAVADSFRNPQRRATLAGFLELMEESLLEAGADLEALQALALAKGPAEGESFSAAEGRAMLKQCTRAGGAPEQAGACLPGFGG